MKQSLRLFFVCLLGASACATQQQSSSPSSGPNACAGVNIPLPKGVEPPQFISGVTPESIAAFRNAQACAEVQVELDGSVTFIRTVRTTDPNFAAAFQDAAVRFRFTPATLKGKPVVARIAVSANANLDAPITP